MNARSGYASTGASSSALTLNVPSRRFGDEMEEDGRGRASPSSASPALSFLSAPSAAATAAKGVREEVGPTVTKADEKMREVTTTKKAEEEREREKAKADRRARDLAAVRSLTAQISDMLARQRIGDGGGSGNDGDHSAAVTEPESESAAGPAAAASEPRRRQQQQDKKDSEDEWADASLAFIVDDYQRERRRDRDSYSKILGTTSRRRRRARARKSPSAPELRGEAKADTLLLPSPTPKIEKGKSANAGNRTVPIPGGASGMKCNASHALSA